MEKQAQTYAKTIGWYPELLFDAVCTHVHRRACLTKKQSDRLTALTLSLNWQQPRAEPLSLDMVLSDF